MASQRVDNWLHRWTASAMILIWIMLAAACGRAPVQAPDQTKLPPSTFASRAETAQLPGASPKIAKLFPNAGQMLRFENISLDQGLSQSVVADIIQDNQGFLWFATQDGLNRFDGYDFMVFKNDPRSTNSISGNTINTIDIDPSGRLWIGTATTGLDCYDPQTGQFTHYWADPNNPNGLGDNSINFIDVGQDGRLWIGTALGGLYLLEPASGTFTAYRNDPSDPSTLSSDTVLSILEDASGDVWVGTPANGLNRLDRSSGKFTRYTNDPNDPDSLGIGGAQALYQDRQGVLWVGTFGGGLNRYDPASEKFIHYLNDPDDPGSLSNDIIQAIYEDRWGRLWVGTNGGGLNLLDRQTGKFSRFLNDPENPNSLPNDQIFAIQEDNSGMLWFGTFGSGIATHDPYKNKFLHLYAEPQNPQSLSANLVWTVYGDNQGILWFGTNGGGLNRYDPKTYTWKHYLQDNSGLLDNNIYYIYQDTAGLIWLGTNNGLDRFDPVNESFSPILTAQPVITVLEDHLGTLWFGSVVSGLGKLEPGSSTPSFYQNLPNDPNSLGANAVSAMSEDSQGNLWVGTFGGGLNLYNRGSDTFTRYVYNPDDPQSISNDTVLCIYPMPDGTLWVGTSGGLNRFDPRTGVFKIYRVEDGLPNDFIYGILEDDYGKMWVSTNRGISRFDPQTQQFKNYDKTDGLQSNEFNQAGYYKNDDGVMFFSGVNGVNVFDPAQVTDNEFIPPVVLTRFNLFNKPVPVGPESPLKQPIEASQAIQLDYTDDFFEFEFAALHFSSPSENQYAYKMENLDEEWNYVGDRRFASYTNVPPGEYMFRVRATNSDGIWNEEGAALKIVIPPPFWQTLWFRLLSGVAVVGMISAVVALRFRAVEIQRQNLEIQVNERTQQLRQAMMDLEQSKEAAEAANQAKSAFLANMSHEFRTPLNAILGFTQIMNRDERLATDQIESVEIIHASSEHLLGLINDVLEMSKIEAGRTTLNPKNFDIHNLVESLEEIFALRANANKVALNLELSPEVPPYVRTDEGKLRQVLMNLLGNAVKFTQDGKITLRVNCIDSSVTEDGNSLCIHFEVEDTGPGIAADEIDQIFLPFVQTTVGKKSPEGTGLGLAISQQFVHLMGGEISARSQVDKGSTFEFDLPVEVISAAELETPRPTRQVVGLEPGQPVYRLLVVDDQEVNRRLLTKIFVPVGFEVREASNGKQALEIWETWDPHLIWMDMRMPVMDGYEATRRIKATTRGQATIIIALTASGLEEEKSIILSEGCDDYMRKPFLEENLFNAVAKHLGARFVYQDLPTTESKQETMPTLVEQLSTSSSTIPTLAERLKRMDPDWLAALERAATLGDEQTITQLANQVETTDPWLKSEINRMATQFDHDSILILIQEARRIQEHDA
jgi:signal transduction histidine kinase/ligand-binding sensor domain-containing protein/CheY-like chemotaxis protein